MKSCSIALSIFAWFPICGVRSWLDIVSRHFLYADCPGQFLPHTVALFWADFHTQTATFNEKVQWIFALNQMKGRIQQDEFKELSSRKMLRPINFWLLKRSTVLSSRMTLRYSLHFCRLFGTIKLPAPCPTSVTGSNFGTAESQNRTSV